MALEIKNTAIADVLIIEPDVFHDRRGFFMETYHQKKYAGNGLHKEFVQDNRSFSSKNVLRGLHYQLTHQQAKLVFVLKGEIFDVVVDIRPHSPTFGRWVGEVLSDQNNRQIFVPEGFAHGFCVLSDTADVIYKCTDLYYPEDDKGINWADKKINIDWPVKNPVMSDKDKSLPMLHDVPKELLPQKY